MHEVELEKLASPDVEYWMDRRDPEFGLVFNGGTFSNLARTELESVAVSLVENGAYMGPDSFSDLASAWAYIAEAIDAYRSRMSREIGKVTDGWKDLQDFATLQTEQRLGPGEVADPKTGRIAYLGKVSGGNAKVIPQAIEEFEPAIKRAGLTFKPPSVTDLRRAQAELKKQGVKLSDLLTVPPKVRGLRWKKLEDDLGSDES